MKKLPYELSPIERISEREEEYHSKSSKNQMLSN